MIAPHERVALLHYNGLGDHLLAWPALRALAHAFPGRLTLLEGPGRHCVLHQDVPFARRVDFRLAEPIERVIDVEASLPEVGRADHFISLAAWANRSLFDLARGMGARQTIGFYAPFDRVVPRVAGRHMFEEYFAIARALVPGATLSDFAGPPTYSPAATAAARALRAELAAPGQPLLFVHPETKAHKQWTAEGWGAALRAFLTLRPEYRAVVVSTAPLTLPLHGVEDRVTYSQAHLELALALVAECQLFAGVDSVFLHAADLTRLPGVAVFGPASDPRTWGFFFSRRAREVCAPDLATLEPALVAEELLALTLR